MRQLIIIASTFVIAIGITSCTKHDTQARKKTFESKLHEFQKYGVGVTGTAGGETNNTYTITIKDGAALSKEILKKSHLELFSNNLGKGIKKILDGRKFAVDVDWKKYSNNENKSVFVYYIADQNDSKMVKQLAAQKALGVYLSYDKNDHLKNAFIKDMDIHSKSPDGGTTRLVLERFGIDTINSGNDEYPVSYETVGRLLKIVDEESNDTFVLKDLKCTTNLTGEFISQKNCELPLMELSGDDFAISTAGMIVTSKTDLQESKISADIDYKIKNISFKADDNFTAELSGIDVAGRYYDIDKKLFDDLSREISAIDLQDKNCTTKHLVKIMAILFDANIGFEAKMSTKQVLAEEPNKFSLVIDDISQTGSGRVGNKINYKENTAISNMVVTDKSTNKTLFELNNPKYAIEIKDLFNFYKETFKLLVDYGIDDNTTKTDMLMNKKLEESFAKMFNDGFEFVLGPVSLDKLHVEKGVPDIDKIDLYIKAKVIKNDLDMNNPMAKLMFMKYLTADGKLEIKEKDLESIMNVLAPGQLPMVMLFAKKEGDRLVFKLEFKDGKLLVNGTPLM